MDLVAAGKFSLKSRAAFFLLATLSLFVVAAWPHTAVAQSTNVAATPPMGWNSWNKFACDVSDKLIREMTDAILTSGMKDAGYQLVNIHDCCPLIPAAAGSTLLVTAP